ncbi:MAG: APC family permease [Acidobacteria bacterium]|nr:APC family permease [Acidobacteriota bacterium]MBS1864918.1 APC family permease [Acidobacteriota bacterium]
MATSSIAADSSREIVSAVEIRLTKERRLTLVALTSLIFFTACGGAYGIEPLVGSIGPGWAMVFIVVAPFIWSLPISLMVAELTTMMPEEGGYYIWVREALGPFWGVQEAVWTMAGGVAALAMFPVLFVSYLTYFIPALSASSGVLAPGMSALLRWLVAFGMVVVVTILNLRGSREVGISTKVGASIVVGAFSLLILCWITWGSGIGTSIGIVRADLATHRGGALLLAISYIVFNYSNWDNASTYAGEVDQPQRTYPMAIGIALFVTILIYLVPVLAGISGTTDPKVWSAEQGWPVIGRLLGGRWMGAILAGAGMVSTWGLLNAQILYVSRLPFVMAVDGWLPKALSQFNRETAVPKLSVICFCVLTSVFVAFSFGSLAVIQCLMYAGALILEILALFVLRVRRPASKRTFRVPCGWWGIGYVCLLPLAFSGLIVYATLRDWRSFPIQMSIVGAAVVAGFLLFFLRRKAAAQLKTRG